MIKIPLLLLGIFCVALGALVSLGTSLTFGISGSDRPGLGFTALFFFDILVVYTLVMLALQVVGLGAISGRVQFATGLVTSILGVIGGFLLILATLTALMLMIGLLVAVPFGTLAYLALFGHFDTSTSRAILSLIMLLKLGGLAMVGLAVPSILNNKTLVMLCGASVLFTFVLGFLHAWPPGFLVSIADAVGAVIFAIVGTAWMLLLLFSSVASLIRTIRGIVPV